MRQLSKPSIPFGIFVLLLSGILVARVCMILPLYTDPQIRADVQTTLQRIADEQGWLLSDMTLVSIGSDQIRINYQTHATVYRQSECFTVMLGLSTLHPCAQ